MCKRFLFAPCVCVCVSARIYSCARSLLNKENGEMTRQRKRQHNFISSGILLVNLYCRQKSRCLLLLRWRCCKASYFQKNFSSVVTKAFSNLFFFAAFQVLTFWYGWAFSDCTLCFHINQVFWWNLPEAARKVEVSSWPCITALCEFALDKLKRKGIIHNAKTLVRFRQMM